MNEVSIQEIIAWLDRTLHSDRFKDYCPNGLQVEGRSDIKRIITGVTASEALLRAAVAADADAVLVHHGWFWRNEDPRVRGTKRARLALALEHELNVIGYHLPLDAHPVLGNNAQLAHELGFTSDTRTDGTPATCGPDDLIWLGRVAPTTMGELARHIGTRLGREPLWVGNADQPVQRVAWCTGGAQGFMQAAVDAGVDVYLTGEASEPQTHLARETGVGFISAGHHATERYGVRALGEALAAQFDIDVKFVDIDNPV